MQKGFSHSHSTSQRHQHKHDAACRKCIQREGKTGSQFRAAIEVIGSKQFLGLIDDERQTRFSWREFYQQPPVTFDIRRPVFRPSALDQVAVLYREAEAQKLRGWMAESRDRFQRLDWYRPGTHRGEAIVGARVAHLFVGIFIDKQTEPLW